MTNKPAVVVVTYHRGDDDRRIFGPFASGDEASSWGFRQFPNNTDKDSGDAVTWCWQDLLPA